MVTNAHIECIGFAYAVHEICQCQVERPFDIKPRERKRCTKTPLERWVVYQVVFLHECAIKVWPCEYVDTPDIITHKIITKHSAKPYTNFARPVAVVNIVKIVIHAPLQ